MSNWTFLNKHRVRSGHYASDESFGWSGAFLFPLQGEARRVCVIAADGLGWRHVSVSFGQASNRTPSWEVMCAVKDLFWEPGDWVVQFHPAHSDYISVHDGCLHMWQCTDGREQPLPPSVMV